MASGPKDGIVTPEARANAPTSVEHQDQLRGPPPRCSDLVCCILLLDDVVFRR